MDGIANVAKQQQTQVNIQEVQASVSQVEQPAKQQENMIEEMQKENSSTKTKINSTQEVEDLVKELNDAMAPMNTNLKFGVDSQNIFYVSVIESDTNKVIRRFPAEKAANVLPKMQEVTGVLFDSKG